MFTDNIVLIEGTSEKVNYRLEDWRSSTLEGKEQKLGVSSITLKGNDKT